VATAIGGTIARKSIAVVGNLLLVHNSQLGLNPHGHSQLGHSQLGQPAATAVTTTEQAVLQARPAVRLQQAHQQVPKEGDIISLAKGIWPVVVSSRLHLAAPWLRLTAAAKWELLLVLRSAEATLAAECEAAASLAAAECVVEAVVKAVVARHCQQHL
jgi:hypothetical protein